MSFLSRLFFLSFCCSLLIFSTYSQEDDHQKTYIVYLGSHSKNKIPTPSHHMRMLQQVIGSTFEPESLLHSYKRSFNGFVAKLTEQQAQKLADTDGVVSVFPNEKQEIQTTRSWDFMGFSQQVNRVPSVESDIIVGVFDTGIWPESPSFNDQGYGPPPAKWKGICQLSSNFSCNNKIIGARSYRSNVTYPPHDIQSPRDSDGHGTHTASTVAGGVVNQASLYGLAEGTARGGVPAARIAVYKICWSDGCYTADTLAAFDDAIADGVDIITLSVNTIRGAIEYFNESIAIGAFHAMKRGILTSNSAGNYGPLSATVRNPSPWILSVAAGTIDRKFLTDVQLGDERIFRGISINTFDLNGQQFPLVYGGDIPNITAGVNGSISRFCGANSVDKMLVKGKIVVCDGFVSPSRADFLEAGAVGLVMQSKGTLAFANSFPLPTSFFGSNTGANISSYINSNSQPTATIFKSHEEKEKLAPFISSFSSRGPNPITPNILKPDLSGPGVEILAAWSPIASVSGAAGDSRKVLFNIISGTSMACPHATAAAAYVKSFHPSWSPAALKSALMTTAFPMNSTSNPDAEFAYGSGHINPVRAVNPGLIYDATEIDYIKFLCGQGYSTNMLRQITGDHSTCSEANISTVFDLNYPSFALSTSPFWEISQIFRRTVTNVGSESSKYEANVFAPLGLNITVNPSVLSFKALGEKQSFEVIVEGRIHNSTASASLVWDDGKHKVRSPIIVFDADMA